MTEQILKPEDRKRLFTEKLAANAERRARQQYLHCLPQHLRSYLEACDFLPKPRTKGLDWMFSPTQAGVGQPHYTPEGYRYVLFGWEEKVLRSAEEIDRRHDHKPALFQPSGNNPLYRVTFGWVRENIRVLWDYSPEQMGVITEDLSAGLVIANYCGYVPDDHNPDEVVYELGVWGF